VRSLFDVHDEIVCLPACLSVCLSVCLYVCMYVCHPRVLSPKGLKEFRRVLLLGATLLAAGRI
jgi:hypothetical protein